MSPAIKLFLLLKPASYLTIREFLNICDRCLSVYNSCSHLAVRIDGVDHETV